MSENMQLYVKPTSNYHQGLPLQTFERLGEEWSGPSLALPFGVGREARRLEVVGWTDLFTGQPCPVHVVAARWLPQPTEAARQTMDGPAEPLTGYLVFGGNSGLRILDPEAEPTPGLDDHLPAGYGRPLVWVEDPADLPAEVLAVVGDLDTAPAPKQRGDVFTLGELAERITGGNLRAMAALLNAAGCFPCLDEYGSSPSQEVPRTTVIALVSQRAGDRVGHQAAALLGETRRAEP